MGLAELETVDVGQGEGPWMVGLGIDGYLIRVVGPFEDRASAELWEETCLTKDEEIRGDKKICRPLEVELVRLSQLPEIPEIGSFLNNLRDEIDRGFGSPRERIII